jgi:signal transduction histidine kinase
VPLLAVLGLLAIGSCVLLAVSALGSRRAALAEQEAATTAQREAGRIAVAVQAVEAVVEHLDPSLCDPRVTPDGPGPDFGGTPSSQAAPEGARLICLPAGGTTHPAAAGIDFADPAIRAALAQSRDRGTGVLSAAPAGGAPPVLAAPIYRARGQLSLEPSDRTTSIRREELAGHAVAVLDVVALLDQTSAWEVVDAGVVLARSGDVIMDDDRTVSADLAALDRRWSVTTRVTGAGLWRPVSAGVALLGLAGAVLLGLADRQRRRLAEDQARAMRRAEERAAAIRALTGIVQHSQDLDEILPALAVQLSDELGLTGVSLAVATATGAERAIFSHGERPDPASRPRRNRVGQVPSGATVAIDLHRADRSIAVMRVVTGRALDALGLELLHIAGEMITSTIVAGRSIEQQQEAVNRLESLDELKTTFLGVASHELRTPATAIAGLATLLATRWDALTEGDRRAFASRIATNADALNALVQDLLDFARLERGDLQLVLAPVVLSDTVAGVLDRLDGVWGSHDVTRAIDPDIEVLGDVSAIERIVTNLVSNAVKFSPSDADVAVSVEERRGRARLVVDDSGPGVPLEEREKIFVRFFRGAGDSVVRTRGVGIGLSVVQDFVAQMGGSVRVEGSPLGGARFVVELDVLDRSRVEERDAATT